jgi:hypothetical protein
LGRLTAPKLPRPSEQLSGLDGDEPAKEAIAERDREITEKSGKPPL